MLKLYFLGKPDATLDTMVFYHPILGDTRTLYRGRGNHINRYISFPWSRAVKALCILLLDTVIGQKNSEKNLVYIEGIGNSPARTLDFALSKKPDWLLDLFGLSSDGNSLIARFFHRHNSERKRPGPVRYQMIMILNSF